MNCIQESSVLNLGYMDNSQNSKVDKSNWTLHDWTMAETGDGQSRAGFVEHMIKVEAESASPETLLTTEESRILYGLQFDQERIRTLAVGSKDQMALNAIVEEMANKLKTSIFVAARARKQQQQQSV